MHVAKTQNQLRAIVSTPFTFTSHHRHRHHHHHHSSFITKPTRLFQSFNHITQNKQTNKQTMHRFKPCLRFAKSTAYRYFSSNRSFSPHNLETAGPIASKLDSRSVVRFRGPDTVKFLQGLLTNDVRKFSEPMGENERTSTLPTPNSPTVSAPPMYTALLTPQGKFLYDLFLYKPPMPDKSGFDPDHSFELFADVDATVLDELLETFKKYRVRSKVEFENVAEDFSCWQRYGGNLPEKSSSTEEPEAASVGWGAGVDCSGESASCGNNLGWQWFNDPRLDSLGFRGIFPSDIIPPLIEADKETDEQNYLLWRLQKGVAEGSAEIPKGEAMPLEYNLAGLNAISFDKGCYMGQELVARTHHRGVIRKRLLPLRFLNDSGEEVEQKVAPGSEVIDTASHKKAGAVRTALGCRGLGLLRLEEAFKGSGALTIQGQENVKVEAVRPDWWPAEWFQEY